MWTLLLKGGQNLYKWSQFLNQDGCNAIYGIHFKYFVLSLKLTLGVWHRELKINQACSNADLFFTARSISMHLSEFVWENIKMSFSQTVLITN